MTSSGSEIACHELGARRAYILITWLPTVLATQDFFIWRSFIAFILCSMISLRLPYPSSPSLISSVAGLLPLALAVAVNHTLSHVVLHFKKPLALLRL